MLSVMTNKVDTFLAGQLSDETRRAYAADLCGFFRVGSMGEISLERIQGITLEQVVAYRNFLLANYKKATVARKMSALRSLFDYFCSVGLLRNNPATSKLARSPKVSNDSNTAGLTRQEAELLLRQPDRNTLTGKRDYAILLLLLTAGLRRSEVVSIKKSKFFQAGSHVGLLVEGKGGKEEPVKMQPRTYAAIFEYCGQHDSDTAFLNQYGRPMSNQVVWRIVDKYVDKAGIKKRITPHSLRHTFVTLAIDGGAHLHQVQTATRHADPKTTMRYYRNRDNMGDNMGDNMDDNAVDYIHFYGVNFIYSTFADRKS